MIPDGIVKRRGEYIAGLRQADAVWATVGRIDLTLMETMMETVMADQLLSALEQAKGKPINEKGN